MVFPMRCKCPSLLIAATCLTAASPAFAADGDQQCNGRGLDNVATVHFPNFNRVGPFAPNPDLREVAIAGDGGLTWERRRIEREELRADLERSAGMGLDDIGVRPGAETSVAAVVPVLGMLNAFGQCTTELLGNEVHSDVFAANPSEIDQPLAPPFANRFDAVILVEAVRGPAQARGANRRQECRAYFVGQGVSADQLREQLYRRLYTVVAYHGGIETTPRSAMNAIVQTRGSTPWRCVAGAVYNVQVSGFASADLLILPEDQPPATPSAALFEIGYGPERPNGEGEPRCHIYFDRSQTTFGDRLIEAFARSNVVVHSDFQPGVPGNAAIQYGPGTPHAAVMARPEAPWRCVAGAIYNIQLAGYGSVGFVTPPAD